MSHGDVEAQPPGGASAPAQVSDADAELLRRTLVSHEEWLMRCVLDYAHGRGYTRFTSTLLEAWRLSVVGLTQTVLNALDRSHAVPELDPDVDPATDPLAVFGVEEARRHRERGVSLSMFLGLFVYYRQAYADLLAGTAFADRSTVATFVDRVFDRLQIAYVSEWASTEHDARIEAMSLANLAATNEKTRLLSIVESLPVATLMVGRDGSIEMMNQRASSLLGGEPTPGASYYSPDQGRERPSWLTAILRAARDRDRVTEVLVTGPEGPRTVVASISEILDVSQRTTGYAVALVDITPQREAQSRLDYLASHDPLTGLPNRRMAWDLIQQAMARATQRGRHVAIYFMDLDFFKRVNDTFGHAVGDGVLRRVAERLTSAVRAGDRLARLGGDEFILIAEDLRGPEDAEVVARSILAALDEPLLVESAELPLRMSIGISMYPDHGADPDILIRQADTAMYQAKADGRAVYRMFSSELTQRSSERLSMEQELQHDVAAGRLTLEYQPIVAVPSGRLLAVEALLRWEHPHFGQVSPRVFLPILEEMGLMPEVGRFVLDQAVRTLLAWRRAGIDVPTVCVNASRSQLEAVGFAQDIADVLSRHGVSPESLTIDIAADPDSVGDVVRTLDVRRIRDLGVQIALDDFGTGATPLSHLRHLPLTTVKVDRAFIAGPPHETESADRTSILQALVTLAHACGFDVVAEGVENPAEAEAVMASGFEGAQGFWYGRPVPGDGLVSLLRD